MAARLTDRQKKKIVADYLELGSYRAAGRKNKVSDGTVKRVVMESGDIEQKIAQKKDENTADIFGNCDRQIYWHGNRVGKAQSGDRKIARRRSKARGPSACI